MSATETRSLALPGHVFRVLALDGNPVPRPAEVPVLWLETAERISAAVDMNHPGVWILGDLADDDRRHGMGIVVEYADRTGKPQWRPPLPQRQRRHPSAPPASPQLRADADRRPAAGVIKDVVMLGGFQQLAFDVVANNPGPTLPHCHQQLHMDFGFMALFDYA